MRTILLAITLLCSSAAFAEPIYLQPGQCILVGSQQVCALQTSAVSTAGEPQTLYLCRFGLHKGSEIPDMKSFEMFQVVIQPNGQKIETALKNYGMNGKDQCEKDAEAKGKK